MTHTTTPALKTNDTVAFAEDTELDGLVDTPLQALVNILLPVGRLEIRLCLLEPEWVDTTVEMSIARSARVASHHDDRTDRTIFGQHASRSTTVTKVSTAPFERQNSRLLTW